MPKLHDYDCLNCEAEFEYMSMQPDESVQCPHCGSLSTHIKPSGGHVFSTIVATSNSSKKFKAGYQHEYVNKPAEKISVSVPRKPKGVSA